MALVLSHISALEYWLSTERLPQEVFRARSLIASPIQLDFDEMPQLSNDRLPLHVLVADESNRHRLETVVTHVWPRPIPKGYVFEIGQGLYVVSPELCLAQTAPNFSICELIKIGYELCGTYFVRSKELLSRDRLTTVKNLTSFIKSAPSIHGVQKVAQALPYIAENSASPMETALAMLLCLPYKYGGYGIKQPLLNFRIDTGKITSAKSFLVCDLFWPDNKLAIEYDSDLFHVGAERITRDSIRRAELNALDVAVITVTRGQIMNRRETEKVAQVLARLTSKRIRYKEPAFSRANTRLRKVVFSKNTFKR